MKRRPRVLYLVTSSGMGGAEQQVRSLALTFHRRGWDVTVVSMLPLIPPLSELAAAGVALATLGMTRGVADPRGLWRLRSVLRQVKPDVLHAHMVHANLMARVSRLLRPTPVVVSTIHNQDEGAQWRYLAYRATDRLSDVTTAPSELAVREAVRRGAASGSGVLLVPNGIAVDEFGPDPAARESLRRELGVSASFVWLAVGRLDSAKAHPDLITAFGEIAPARPATLLIAGVGPLGQEISAMIRDRGLDDRVRLLGLRRDIPRLMQAADAFVMSSAWEGLPLALLEAAASALPVVATDVGGSREAVIDGVSGYLVPPRDPPALARAMADVMELPEPARRAMGQAGRHHMGRSFDLDVVVDRWERLYRDLLARRSR